jgi:serine/threonine-protein phosphatase 2A regulatory subunit A
VFALIRIKDFETTIMAMLKRLMTNEYYSSKCAAIHLFPCVYSYFSTLNRQEIMNMYNQVSEDETPQVRKQAAIVLNEMIKLIPKVSETELLNIFSRFYKDDQDTVRMQGIDSCV